MESGNLSAYYQSTVIGGEECKCSGGNSPRVKVQGVIIWAMGLGVGYKAKTKMEMSNGQLR